MRQAKIISIWDILASLSRLGLLQLRATVVDSTEGSQAGDGAVDAQPLTR